MPQQTHPRLPSVERLLQYAGPLIDVYGRNAVTAAVRTVLDEHRRTWKTGRPTPDHADIMTTVQATLEHNALPSLRPAINATGVILHTGLGRAALPPPAVDQLLKVARGHSTLEIDVDTGERGSRHDHASRLLCELTGAEDAIVVNNDAGAVLLALAAISRGREVIVSRGELVEIGGGFRVPEVMAASGARMVEVGTTNKTRAADYEQAITPETGAILKVHPSNYRIVGFTESASLEQLRTICDARGVPLLDDWGSGSLIDLRPLGLGDEPPVSERLKQGAHVVMFSGDKLLGGPQAGILVGCKDLIGVMRVHPLARALRCDKLSLAALEATLRVYRKGTAWEDVPTLSALSRSIQLIVQDSEQLAGNLRQIEGVSADVVPSVCRAGAGAMPGEEIPSRAVAVSIQGMGPNTLAERLRLFQPAVFVHVTQNAVWIEPRTLLAGEAEIVVEAVRKIAKQHRSEGDAAHGSETEG